MTASGERDSRQDQDDSDDQSLREPSARGVLAPRMLCEQLEDAYRSSHQTCLRAAVRIVRDLTLAEEVVQEAFLAAWQHAPTRYDPAKGALGSWLVTLTRHKAIDAVRRAEHMRRLLQSEQAVTLPSEQESAEDAAARTLEAVRLRSAVASLSTDQQRVLLLSYWGGLSQSRIAIHDATPLGTVKTRTAAGLSRLREVFSALEGS